MLIFIYGHLNKQTVYLPPGEDVHTSSSLLELPLTGSSSPEQSSSSEVTGDILRKEVSESESQESMSEFSGIATSSRCLKSPPEINKGMLPTC